jgi:hypothetical protein
MCRPEAGGMVSEVRTSRAFLVLLPPLSKHFLLFYTSEIRHVNRPYLWPTKGGYNNITRQQKRHNNTLFILAELLYMGFASLHSPL